jgi:hypothetical protein
MVNVWTLPLVLVTAVARICIAAALCSVHPVGDGAADALGGAVAGWAVADRAVEDGAVAASQPPSSADATTAVAMNEVRLTGAV